MPSKQAAEAGAGRGVLARSDALPLYRQVQMILEAEIAGGHQPPGSFLPSEADIASRFGVSRITAKRALDDMAGAGLVVRQRGRGTKVLKQHRPTPVRAGIEDWLETITEMGRVTSAEVLAFEHVPAPPAIAEALGLDTGAEVQRAVRVRRLGTTPMSYLETYLPPRIAAGIGARDLADTPLLKLLERAGVQVSAAQQSISATSADPTVATALEVAPGTALLEVTRLVRDAADMPVEHIRALYRSDLYHLEMTMRRVSGPDGRGWMAEAR